MAELEKHTPESGEVRAELVARVRHEIQAGSYETPEKLEIAIQRLLIDIESRGHDVEGE